MPEHWRLYRQLLPVFMMLLTLLAACGGSATPAPASLTLDEFFCQDLSGVEGPGDQQLSRLEAYGQLANDGGSVHVDAVRLEIVDGGDQVLASETLGIDLEVEVGSQGFDLTFEDPPGVEGGTCRVTFLAGETEVASATSEIANRFGGPQFGF